MKQKNRDKTTLETLSCPILSYPVLSCIPPSQTESRDRGARIWIKDRGEIRPALAKNFGQVVGR